MLPKIVRLNSGLSPRSRWSLALLGFALLALPTWYQEAQSRQMAPGATMRPRASGGHSASFATPVNRPKLPAMAPPAVEFFPEPSPIESQLLTALEKDVDFDFDAISLVQILEELGGKHDIQFVLDNKSLADESIASDASDISCKVRAIPLKSALNILLEPKGLTFLIIDNVLKVTTETKARSTMMARTYPVRDLVSNVDADYQLLCKAIQTSVGGEQAGAPWAEIDGEGGSISILPATGCLVVRQNARAQHSVLQLLRAIRGANAEEEAKSPHAKAGATK